MFISHSTLSTTRSTTITGGRGKGRIKEEKGREGGIGKGDY